MIGEDDENGLRSVSDENVIGVVVIVQAFYCRREAYGTISKTSRRGLWRSGEPREGWIIVLVRPYVPCLPRQATLRMKLGRKYQWSPKANHAKCTSVSTDHYFKQ